MCDAFGFIMVKLFTTKLTGSAAGQTKQAGAFSSCTTENQKSGKEAFTMAELTYTKNGAYLLPDLMLDDEDEQAEEMVLAEIVYQ